MSSYGRPIKIREGWRDTNVVVTARATEDANELRALVAEKHKGAKISRSSTYRNAVGILRDLIAVRGDWIARELLERDRKGW